MHLNFTIKMSLFDENEATFENNSDIEVKVTENIITALY